MRILVASQPKCGNVWMRKLLVDLYCMIDLNERLPGTPPARYQLPQFIADGKFLDESVLQEHYYPQAPVLKALEGVDCKIVTMLRNPYDAFVSYYHYANAQPEIFRPYPSGSMIGRPIDHPDVINYLETDYRTQMQISAMWVKSRRSVVVRYEDMLVSPKTTLLALTRTLRPACNLRIEAAIRNNSADQLKKAGGWIAKHIRVGGTGDWKNQLTARHLSVFRKHYGPLIRFLGYDVY